ncbi:MAG: response regulator [Sulfurovum sp.]|nr:response regulator [Sulfurovum sp.]
MKVAIVEDEGIMALFLKKTISSFDHEVVAIYSNGAELLKYMQSAEVDVIFMDINIKGIRNGIEVAKEVQKLYPLVSFVFVSAYLDNETITQACEVEPLGYLTKPVQPKQLETILILVSKHRENFLTLENEILKIGAYTYNAKIGTLHHREELISLSTQEHLCFHVLLRHKDTQVRSKLLIESIWGSEENRSASLRELLTRLRKKLPELTIKNIPNIGYSLEEKE